MINTYNKELIRILNIDHQYNGLKETAELLLQELQRTGEEIKIFTLLENNNRYTMLLWGLRFEIRAEIPLGQGRTKFTAAQLNTYLVNDDKTREQVYSCSFDSNGVINDGNMRGEFGDFYLKELVKTLFENAGEKELMLLLI